MRYKFFLVVIGFLHFPYLSQAVTLPNKPILSNFAKTRPRLLHVLQNGSNTPSSSKMEEAALLRKTMRIQAMIQRSWISSMVVPGLGQVYNKDYWKVPCLYFGFALFFHRIYSEHQEMQTHQRTLLTIDSDKPSDAWSNKRIWECARTRNLFIMIASAWYLLNIFDAYAGGHNQTVNFKDDIATKSISKPTAAKRYLGGSSI